MITSNSAPGVAHQVDTSVEPWHLPHMGNRPNDGLNARLLLSSGAVQATKRPVWWRRALRALGVRA